MTKPKKKTPVWNQPRVRWIPIYLMTVNGQRWRSFMGRACQHSIGSVPQLVHTYYGFQTP